MFSTKNCHNSVRRQVNAAAALHLRPLGIQLTTRFSLRINLHVPFLCDYLFPNKWIDRPGDSYWNVHTHLSPKDKHYFAKPIQSKSLKKKINIFLIIPWFSGSLFHNRVKISHYNEEQHHFISRVLYRNAFLKVLCEILSLLMLMILLKQTPVIESVTYKDLS